MMREATRPKYLYLQGNVHGTDEYDGYKRRDSDKNGLKRREIHSTNFVKIT